MKKQIDGINITKTIACISVILLHYTQYFYSTVNNSTVFVLLHSFRWIVFGCIGYYCLCAGFLQYKKTFSKKYYKKIIKILVLFLIYCTLSFIFIHKPSNLSFSSIYQGITYYFFEFKGYYWYMAMYFGLYLIIPFLNMIIANTTKKQHLFLIIISIILFSGHDFIMQARDIQPFFSNINISGYYSSDLFPLTYYFIGAYINKYNINISKNISSFIFLIFLFLHAYCDLRYTHIHNYNLSDHIYTFNQYGNIFTIITCVTSMLIFKNIKLKYTSKFISFIAKYTLPVYLGLGIMDKYQKTISNVLFNSKIDFSFKGMLLWLAIELIGALLMSIIVTKFMDFIKEIYIYIIKKIKATNPVIKYKKYIINKYSKDLNIQRDIINN